MPEYPVSASNYRDPYDHDHDHAACLHQPSDVVTPAGSLVANITALHKLAEDILDPEMYGFSVTSDVRDAARRALGFTAVEWEAEGKPPPEVRLYAQSQMDARSEE